MKKLLLLICGTIMISGCNNAAFNNSVINNSYIPQKDVKLTNFKVNTNIEKETSVTKIVKDEFENKKESINQVTFTAIGDILIHSTVYKKAKISKNSYDFKPLLNPVKPYLEKSDITMANSESIVGGQEIGVSTYPSFNSPFEVADTLKYLGIDIVTMANNHTLDRGEKAIKSAIQHWDKIGVKHVGAYTSKESSEKIEVIEKNNIKISFLAYTYGTNGIKTPKGKEYLVNYIDKAKIKSDIAKAKTISDVIIINFHFGNEYERVPNESQKQLVQYAVDEGANIIIGHHPHVLQPMDWITAKDGHKAFVIYSLGNFLSGQQGNYKDIGGIINMTIQKTEKENDKKIDILNINFIPTFVNKGFVVQPMKDATESDFSNHTKKYENIMFHMNQYINK